MFFANLERLPKNHLGKHLPTKNNPLVVFYNEYSSTSKYQVKRIWFCCKVLAGAIQLLFDSHRQYTGVESI